MIETVAVRKRAKIEKSESSHGFKQQKLSLT